MPTDDTQIATIPDPTRQLVALTPDDMPRQQQTLLDWLDRRIRALKTDRSDAIDNARIAADHGWRADNFDRMAKKLERQVIYYEKLHAAVAAGFIIVPDFDVEVFAVRTTRARPTRESAEREGTMAVTTAVAELLPAGVGRYVGGKHETEVERWTENDPTRPGQTRNRLVETAVDFTDVEFPVKVVRPEVLTATTRAMALQIFDRVGVVTGKREDPVVVGQILKPTVTKANQQWGRPPRVSFFIAWFLDPEAL